MIDGEPLAFEPGQFVGGDLFFEDQGFRRSPYCKALSDLGVTQEYIYTEPYFDPAHEPTPRWWPASGSGSRPPTCSPPTPPGGVAPATAIRCPSPTGSAFFPPSSPTTRTERTRRRATPRTPGPPGPTVQVTDCALDSVRYVVRAADGPLA